MQRLLLALALLPVVPSSGPELAFAPRDGAELVESFEHSWSLELVDQEVVVTFDGEDAEQELPDVELVLSSEETVSFTTEYVDVEDGRARRVHRTYDALSSRTSRCATGPDGEEHCAENEGASELEGTSVDFEWDADEESYSRSFAADDDEADQDLLAGLEADHVLAVLLPDFDVEEGDEWEVDALAFRRISSPGGDLAILEEDDDPEEDAEFREQFYDNLEGTVTVRHGGTRTVGAAETEVVVLEVAFELETWTERERDLDLEDAEGTRFERLEFAFDLEGEVRWDTEAGHARSLRLGGDMGLSVEENRTVESEQGEVVVRSTQEFEGEVTYRTDVE